MKSDIVIFFIGSPGHWYSDQNLDTVDQYPGSDPEVMEGVTPFQSLTVGYKTPLPRPLRSLRCRGEEFYIAVQRSDSEATAKRP